MTDSLIRTAARRPLSALARPSVVAAFAIVLAYGGGLWLNVLHAAEGGYERNEPPLILHWLRDSTLALPLILIAVWAGVLMARRLIERTGCSSRLVSALTLGACVALLAAVARRTPRCSARRTGGTSCRCPSTSPATACSGSSSTCPWPRWWPTACARPSRGPRRA
jgi:hypothetical protein